ncbi:MAG: DUF423 domain-containing protein [Gammaproteobacteria bacterium]|nr:DUF423 domain-containing protein [Gammaproteobacteria bacterium]
MPLLFVLLATLLLASSVFLGAYGTHGLFQAGAAVSEVRAWDWANQLQVAHSLGLLAVGLMLRRSPDIVFYKAAGWLLIVGIAVFSGTNYMKLMGGPDFASLTPYGGMALAVAWLSAAAGVWRDFRS